MYYQVEQVLEQQEPEIEKFYKDHEIARKNVFFICSYIFFLE